MASPSHILCRALGSFLLPKLNRRFWVRLAVEVVLAWLFFSRVCTLSWTRGESMLPTYGDGEFMLCWQPRYWFRAPRPGEVVMLRLAGPRVLLLKRVVAVAGDSVEFRAGVLLVNGEEPEAFWASLTPCDWELPERKVRPGHLYVLGDNRSMTIDEHEFGEIAVSRVFGGPLFQ
jgi:signal peptidase I